MDAEATTGQNAAQPLANAEALLRITFGLGGDDTHYLGAGWSGNEPGFRWTVDEQSELWIENPGAERDCVLELDVAPHLHSPTLPHQRLSVFARGTLVGRSTLTGPANLGFRIPATLFAGPGPVRLVFEHPDAKRPSDFGHDRDDRKLAINFRHLRLSRLVGDLAPKRLEAWQGVIAADVGKLTGLPAAEFMLKFESLGDNCEFGLVQRRCGAEPLGLLRFSNLELPRLIGGLQRGFDGLGDVRNLECWLDEGKRREYVIRDHQYSLVFHTFLYEGDVDRDQLLTQQARRLGFLQRKLVEDLQTGDKIFVYKRNVPLTEQDVLPLHAELNRYGSNTLLWVVPGDTDHAPGTVDRLMPGLLRGHIDRFAPQKDAHALSLEVWLSICVNAFRINQDE
jgi:hypothetical protein